MHGSKEDWFYKYCVGVDGAHGADVLGDAVVLAVFVVLVDLFVRTTDTFQIFGVFGLLSNLRKDHQV